MTEIQDNELFLRFLAGDEESFRMLAGRYQNRGYWVALNIVKDPESAADVVQDAFVKIIRSGSSFDPAQSFRTWFFRILSNTAIDSLRRAKKRAVTPIDEMDDIASESGHPGQEMADRSLAKKIAETMADLPPKYRQALVLRDIEGLSCIEIAEALDLTHSTARWRIHHARKMFQKIWISRNGDVFPVLPEE